MRARRKCEMIYRKGEEEVEKRKKSGPTKYIYRDHVKIL